jgi:hypothetical protein
MEELMKKLSVFLIVLICTPIALFAQEGEPFAVLEYFDDPDGVFVTSAEGEDLFPEYGMELLPGDKLETTSSVAEIRLDPNGSLIKLAPKTEFVIDTLQNRGGAEANTFSLVSGKLRAVAARTGTAQYQIKTQTAVCGVRGTIFGLEVLAGVVDAAIVEKGLIAFQKIGTNEFLELGAGQFADTFAETFEPIAVSPEQISNFFEGIQEFVGENMNPDTVPGNEPTGDDTSADTTEDSQDQEDASSDTTDTPPLVDDTADTEDTTVTEEPSAPGPLDPVMDYLREVLGMEIGAITIDSKTYSKAVLQPQFTLGRLKLGLYLPIIYETNMFDPGDWYHPKGNDEWSFGTDQDWENDILGGVSDILSDLFLKIRYVEWGEQRDPFYIKVGNLKNMNLGHGILMRNYANDESFPAIRRIGVNMGFDLGGFGMETVVNDLAEPEIFGARMYFRPAPETFPMAIGVSGIADIDPAGEIPVDPTDTSGTDPALAVGDPIFISGALDLDLPMIDNDAFSIIAFADVAAMLPYLRESITDGTNTVGPGFIFEALLDEGAAEGEFPLKNYGFAGGLLGNIFIADYRIEYRNYKGTFKPAFYGPNYDRIRGEYAVELKDELLNPQSVVPVMGIYGEAGITIAEKVRFAAGYMWPWEADFAPSDDDLLSLEAEIFSGTIPVIDLHGSFSYVRTKFAPTLMGTNANLSLFDANTIVKGELIYPIAPTLDIAVLVTTTLAHDDSGNLILDPDTGSPQVSPSISIETRVHF